MATALDPKLLRTAFGQFATGITVITTMEPGGVPRGFTANSFTSVSLDPPLVLVCIANSAASCEIFCKAGSFAINVLSEKQKDVSGLFATQRPDKFDNAKWRSGAAGTPLIDGALAWFECAHHDTKLAGDHVILIGRVTGFGHDDGRPLGYFRGSYFTLGIEDPLVDAVARGASTIIGAIFQRDNALLLEENKATGELSVPSVGRGDAPASISALQRKYSAPHFKASIEFVYAVYEDKRSGTVAIHYRGHAEGEAPAGTAFFAFDDIPFDRIADGASRTMLKRYVSEARQGGFAIYMGDEEDGVVRSVG